MSGEHGEMYVETGELLMILKNYERRFEIMKETLERLSGAVRELDEKVSALGVNDDLDNILTHEPLISGDCYDGRHQDYENGCNQAGCQCLCHDD